MRFLSRQSISLFSRKEVMLTGIILFCAFAVTLVSGGYDRSGSAGSPLSSPRIDFENTPPSGFPAGMPLEQNVFVHESYMRSYPGQDQMTYVYTSKRAYGDILTELRAYFENQGYITINAHDTDTLTALYMRRAETDASIVLEKGETAKVTVNILERI